MSRRKRPRNLSSDDLEVWQKVAETVSPLSHTSKPAGKQHFPIDRGPAKTTPAPVQRIGTIRSGDTSVPPVTVNLAPKAVDRLTNAPVQMDKRNYDRLKKGKLPVERRIDLHGMTAAAAHSALRQFLIGAYADGVRVVLVITGKGRVGGLDDSVMPRRRGVIRHALPDWLDQEPLRQLIVQAIPAAAKHGGSGAFYVYLRRKR